MNVLSNRKSELQAQFDALLQDNEAVATAYAAVKNAFAENSNGPQSFYAKIELTDALKKAQVPERDAKDMTAIVTGNLLERGR